MKISAADLARIRAADRAAARACAAAKTAAAAASLALAEFTELQIELSESYQLGATDSIDVATGEISSTESNETLEDPQAMPADQEPH